MSLFNLETVQCSAEILPGLIAQETPHSEVVNTVGT